MGIERIYGSAIYNKVSALRQAFMTHTNWTGDLPTEVKDIDGLLDNPPVRRVDLDKVIDDWATNDLFDYTVIPEERVKLSEALIQLFKVQEDDDVALDPPPSEDGSLYEQSVLMLHGEIEQLRAERVELTARWIMAEDHVTALLDGSIKPDNAVFGGHNSERQYARLPPAAYLALGQYANQGSTEWPAKTASGALGVWFDFMLAVKWLRQAKDQVHLTGRAKAVLEAKFTPTWKLKS